MNAQEAILFITTLEELGHKQQPIPLQTDNSTANGIMNRTIKQKRSKAFDMRHWWLVDRCDQGQFKVYWAPGKLSLADYFTKRHPASHHAALRPIYLCNNIFIFTGLQLCCLSTIRTWSSHFSIRQTIYPSWSLSRQDGRLLVVACVAKSVSRFVFIIDFTKVCCHCRVCNS